MLKLQIDCPIRIRLASGMINHRDALFLQYREEFHNKTTLEESMLIDPRRSSSLLQCKTSGQEFNLGVFLCMLRNVLILLVITQGQGM